MPFSAWLYRIAHNLVANWHRDLAVSRKSLLMTCPFCRPRVTTPERNLVRSQEQDALLKMIPQASAGERRTC
ncbi:MAG: hypothetical protein IPP55_02080 [Anaerolineales bacterium]|nr:hypothetical protein [Anaerolineales bacterium]